MAIYFMGGEDIDFLPLGTTSISTDPATFRAAFARCAVSAVGGLGNAWTGQFSTPATIFWMGLRTMTAAGAGLPLVTLSTGGSRRLGLLVESDNTLVLSAWDASGAVTQLAASQPGAAPTNLYKLDVFVSYAQAGQVRVFVNQIEVITFNGDVTQSAATTLDGFALSQPAATGSAAFSEVFVTDRDSRTLMLKTHVPASDGNGNQWTGSFNNIDEIQANESDTIATNVAGAISTFGVTGLPSGSTLAVRGFKVSAYAARGETGPQTLGLGVQTNGAQSFASPASVDTGWTRLGQIYETNPVNGAAWTADDINAIQIGVKSGS